MRPIIIFLLYITTTFSVSAQYESVDTSILSENGEISKILTYDDYLTNILKYHPIAKQADLRLKLAAAERLAAKGFFDPELTSSFKQKNFDEKQYYRIFENRLRVPTRLGLDVVGGYTNTSGEFLNAENTTDPFGLWNIGIEANLLQGLLVDERRTALRQAEIFQAMAENQKQIMLNDLLYKASVPYLEWQQYHANQQTIENSIEVANTYFENTKQSFFNGEKTAIDTLEAFMILQDRQVLAQKNEMSLTKARQSLENFLWFNDIPLELQPVTEPENYDQEIFSITTVQNIPSIVEANPIIQEKLNKQEYYEVEQRWKREKLKPKLKVKYNPLIATSENSIAPAFVPNDFTFGVDFAVPIPMRSERAAVEQGRIKIEENYLDIQNKRNELENKIENSLMQQNTIRMQLALQERNVNGYQQLLDAENQKFLFGESSVFLLNKRQEKYIDGQLKLIELNVKLQKELLSYLYYTNSIVN